MYKNNSFDDNTLVKEYIQRAATAMEEDNLLQDSAKNEEEEEHDEEEKERTDHPLTTYTPNNKPISNVSIYCNDSIDAHVLENYSEEDSCLAFESIDIDKLNRRPIELQLECSWPDYIDRTEVSNLLVENLITGLKNDVDIGFIPEVPTMTSFEETPAGI